MKDKSQITFDEMEHIYLSLPYNAQRVAATLDALAMTEQRGTASRLHVLFHLAYAYAIGDDMAKALPVCAEFFSLLEQCPDYNRCRVEAPALAMIAAFAAISLPQIPLEQCQTLLDEFHQQVKKYGVGERLWQMHACNFKLVTGDLVGAEKHLRAFRATPRDSMSECRACEASNAAECLLELGLRAEANATLQPVLDGSLTCEQQPWSALSMLIHDALNMREFESAQELGQRLSRKNVDRRGDLTSVGALLRLQAYCGPKQSLSLLEKGIRWSIGVWDQKHLFDFYRGAWDFCVKLGEDAQTIPLSLPRKFPCWRADGRYESSVLAEWFYTQITKITTQFDQRNGSDYFSKRIVPLHLPPKNGETHCTR